MIRNFRRPFKVICFDSQDKSADSSSDEEQEQADQQEPQPGASDKVIGVVFAETSSAKDTVSKACELSFHHNLTICHVDISDLVDDAPAETADASAEAAEEQTEEKPPRLVFDQAKAELQFTTGSCYKINLRCLAEIMHDIEAQINNLICENQKPF